MSYQEREAVAVEAIKSAIPSSLKSDMIPESKGLFAELYKNDEVFPDHFLASAIDGVGTKLLLAEAMGKFDTVGIDLVAMSANDLATLGPVSPFLFMDYLACQKKIQEQKITGKIIKGIVKGLEKCDASNVLRNSIRMNFGKGETASVDELLSGLNPGMAFDLAGCMIGFIKKEKLSLEVKDGDKIIALPSSGPHSNGYTDLRLNLLNGDFEKREEYKKMYKGKYSVDSEVDGVNIGESLLEPTKIYLKDFAKISNEFPVVGINNTGYGLKNLNRIKGFEFRINDPIKPHKIFSIFQKESKFSDEKMYTTFNMGMGFFVISRKEDSLDVLQNFKDAKIVGDVKKSDKNITVLEKDSEKLVFEGY